MKSTCALLVLGLVSAASAYFSDGEHDPKIALLLFAHADNIDFKTTRTKYVLQFNACKNYDIYIHHIELMQFQGKELTVKTIKGGPGSHMVGLELTNGLGLANIELKVWGVWVEKRKNIDHEHFFKVTNEWKDCPHPVKN